MLGSACFFLTDGIAVLVVFFSSASAEDTMEFAESRVERRIGATVLPGKSPRRCGRFAAPPAELATTAAMWPVLLTGGPPAGVCDPDGSSTGRSRLEAEFNPSNSDSPQSSLMNSRPRLTAPNGL
jgi:hypothetical protein